MKFIVCVYHRRLCAVVHCVLFVFGCQVRKIYKISRHLPACGFSSSDFGCQVRTYCIKLVGIYPRAVSVAQNQYFYDTGDNTGKKVNSPFFRRNKYQSMSANSER